MSAFSICKLYPSRIPSSVWIRSSDSCNSHPQPAEIDAAAAVPLSAPIVRPPSRDDFVPVTTGNRRGSLALGLIACGLVVAAGWRFADMPGACLLPRQGQLEMASKSAADLVARRIVAVESSGDAAARNSLSTATGAGQFLDGTWLDMIRAYRPDLGGRAESEILDLRYDPELSREMVVRLAEQNAAVLVRRCLPVTPGTLYLSHFAGGAGAAAVLSAPGHADARRHHGEGGFDRTHDAGDDRDRQSVPRGFHGRRPQELGRPQDGDRQRTAPLTGVVSFTGSDARDRPTSPTQARATANPAASAAAPCRSASSPCRVGQSGTYSAISSRNCRLHAATRPRSASRWNWMP
jgi:hypothetical protein